MIHNRNNTLHCHLLSSVFALAVSFNAIGETTDCPPAVVTPFQYGPYNYRNPEHRKNKLHIVEIAHFTTQVATLKKSERSVRGAEGDIDYTLRAFPNHPRALQSLADLAIRKKKATLEEMNFSVPCYFIRASKFVPTDGMVNAIYAYYLADIGQKDMAIAEAGQAIRKEPNNPRVAYEVGLAYFYMGDHKTAMEYAVKAKSLGSTAIGLDKLLSQPGSKDPSKPDVLNDH